MTFISNHDAGRFAFFLKQDNPGMDSKLQGELVLLGHELLLTARGQPVLYYGDEQGMAGIGDDRGSREDMFASRTPQYRDLSLLGTTRTGADDKFDTGHPFYRTIRRLVELRTSHPGLSRGAMLLRKSGQPHVFAFSRIERGERVEYLVALNNSRTDTVAAALHTCQPEGAAMQVLFDSARPDPSACAALVAGANGNVAVSLAPLECVIWQAEAPLPAPATAPSITFASPAGGSTLTFAERSTVGHVFPVRQELLAEVAGGDGYAEVTFVMRRASRPGQYELLGTQDSPPYHVYWRPPADLARSEELEFIATADDLRGHRASAKISRIHVAPTSISFGIKGAKVPMLVREPDAVVTARAGGDLTLVVHATGTARLEYSWVHDGAEIAGASQPTLTLDGVSADAAGHYIALVRNREGTAISRDVLVRVGAR